MIKYPHAITKKCCDCGRTFTCKGEEWITKKDRCAFEFGKCSCAECNPRKPNGRSGFGCVEIELREIVVFT